MSDFDGMTFETLPEALVVGVQSEKLDYMVLDKLERRITAQATMAGKFNVILDLGEVEFIPSMLMSVLVKTLNTLGDQGRKFLLVGMNRHIRASLKLTRIDVLFDLHDSVDAARCSGCGRVSVATLDNPRHCSLHFDTQRNLGAGRKRL